MSWQKVAPGVWVDREPIDPVAARRLMQERLAAGRQKREAEEKVRRAWTRAWLEGR